jgi:hypothetical protein
MNPTQKNSITLATSCLQAQLHRPIRKGPIISSTAKLLSLLAAAPAALATPTGLNNIPTADTVPSGTLAIQAFSSLGGPNQFAANGPGKHSFWMGFKTGLELQRLRIEWGLDSPLAPGNAGPLFGQVKTGITPWDNGLLTFGVAGIALTDSKRAGDPFYYGILSHDFGILRTHVGYGLQTRGDSVLLGVDRNIKFWDRDLNLNTDLVQTRNGHGWLPAIGAKYPLNKHIVLEAWSNFPDQGTVSFIRKINFVFQFS